jgi:septal ring factor EnvC (AmiA/AmiB activator)
MRFAARSNAIVTAPFEGRVVVARDWRPIGNLVILDVGGGYHILLLGVGDILVEENQRISAGEPVAQMAEGDGVLDLEIRKNGEPVNPAFWLSSKDVNGFAL